MKKKLLAQAVDFDFLNRELKAVGFKFTDTTTIGGIISALLPYVFVLAGLIMFVFFIAGGFELLTSAGNPEKVKSGQGKIVSALIGFLIIFVAYWLAQVLEIVLGVSILG